MTESFKAEKIMFMESLQEQAYELRKKYYVQERKDIDN